MKAVIISILLLVGATLLGCGNAVSPFPPGLEPLDDEPLESPPGECPEEFTLGGSRTGSYEIILGRGYIRAPIDQVWAAYQNPGVGADRRTSPGWSTEPIEDPEYFLSYLVKHSHPTFDVHWDVTWRHGAVEGTVEAPELVAMRWQKTNGSTLISVIEGSILLRPACDGTATDIELAYHASAAGSNRGNYENYMQDMYDDALAIVNGEPLPTF